MINSSEALSSLSKWSRNQETPIDSDENVYKVQMQLKKTMNRLESCASRISRIA
jgi:hypothetical protein